MWRRGLGVSCVGGVQSQYDLIVDLEDELGQIAERQLAEAEKAIGAIRRQQTSVGSSNAGTPFAKPVASGPRAKTTSHGGSRVLVLLWSNRPSPPKEPLSHRRPQRRTKRLLLEVPVS